MTDRWIKLNANWMESEWLIVLSAESRLAWVQLICYAKTNGFVGRVRSKSAMVFARQNFIGQESVEQMILAAKANGALEEIDGEWLLTGWAKHQGDETTSERSRRYRERQKEKTVTGVTRDVTLEESRVEEKRREATTTNAGASAREKPPGDAFSGEILMILQEVPGYARATGTDPDKIGQVISDFPQVPKDAWHSVARELRDQALERPALKDNSVFAAPVAADLRKFLREVIVPRMAGSQNGHARPRRDESGPRKRVIPENDEVVY